MTAIRDRQSDLDEEPAGPAWDERPIVGNKRGLPWWAVVLLAFAVSAVAAWFDIHRQGTLGRIYQGAYILSCVIAVCWVRRRNLFGPMVQPPLVFAVTAIGAATLAKPGTLSSGLKQVVFSVALPLTSNFPTMGLTTAAVMALGLLRLWLQRNPEPSVRANRRGGDRDPLAGPGVLDGPDGRSDDRFEPRSDGRDAGGPGRAAAAGDFGQRRPPRDRMDPARAPEGPRGGRRGFDPDQGTRQQGERRSGRPERSARSGPADEWDQPPRSGRGRSDPPGGDRPPRADRPDRRSGGSDPGRRRNEQQPPRREMPDDQPRRNPRRRPDGRG